MAREEGLPSRTLLAAAAVEDLPHRVLTVLLIGDVSEELLPFLEVLLSGLRQAGLVRFPYRLVSSSSCWMLLPTVLSTLSFFGVASLLTRIEFIWFTLPKQLLPYAARSGSAICGACCARRPSCRPFNTESPSRRSSPVRFFIATPGWRVAIPAGFRGANVGVVGVKALRTTQGHPQTTTITLPPFEGVGAVVVVVVVVGVATSPRTLELGRWQLGMNLVCALSGHEV